MTRWIGVAFGAGWLMVAEAVASPPVGPREALESAIVQVVSILQHGEINGAPVGDSSAELRRITREVFDFLIGGVSLVSSYRSQFERVIRSESYGALRDRLQGKSLDTAVAERQRESK